MEIVLEKNWAQTENAAVKPKFTTLSCNTDNRGPSQRMAFRMVGRGLRYLKSPPLFQGKSLAEKFVAAVGNRNMSQEKPISRFPVPNMDTLPEDMQERMKEVEEKVGE